MKLKKTKEVGLKKKDEIIRVKPEYILLVIDVLLHWYEVSCAGHDGNAPHNPRGLSQEKIFKVATRLGGGPWSLNLAIGSYMNTVGFLYRFLKDNYESVQSIEFDVSNLIYYLERSVHENRQYRRSAEDDPDEIREVQEEDVRVFRKLFAALSSGEITESDFTAS